MEIRNICVAGGGRMGRQIALQAAICGYGACVYDIDPKVLADVEQWADDYLAGRVTKGRLTQKQADKARALFLTQCIVEVEDIKRTFFRQLDSVVGDQVIIATNSSYMVSSKFADCVKNPSRLCNMHFYNPALVMKFVEVVQGPHTSAETAQAAYDFCVNIGKKPIWQKKEIDGFAGNYLIEALMQRARYLVAHGYCTYQDVDIAMEEGFHHPMGPFRLTDLTGVNLSFDMLDAEYKRTGVKPDMYDTYREMVERGQIGRETGHGFYDYT